MKNVCEFCGITNDDSRGNCAACGAPRSMTTGSASITLVDKVSNALFGSKIRDGETKIIDMSWWQDPKLIDYDLLADAIDGAILRVAYGKYIDSRFETHYRNLYDRGKAIGIYPYIIGNQKYTDQVNAVRDAIKGYDLALGHWADVEDIGSTTGLNLAFVNNWLTYADDVFGFTQDIYTSVSRWRAIMQDSKAHGHRRLWVAHWTTAAQPILPVGWKDWYLWQYTDRARFDAYKQGGIDCSRFNGTEAQWYWSLEESETPVITEPELTFEQKAEFAYNWIKSHGEALLR